MALTVSLALLAALLFAVAAVLQQQGTSGVDDDDALGAGMLASLARRPVWVLGMACDVAGFGVQAWALATGSLLLVQPLLVTTLLFALPLGARATRRALTTDEWGWSGVLVASLFAFVLLGQPTAGVDRTPFTSWIPILVLSTPVVALCVLSAGSLPHGTRRSLSLAIAAGLLLGLSAPLTKGAIDGFADGIGAGLLTWELWGMALTAALGTFWQQSSYQAGDVQTSLPTVSVLKPVVAMVLGLTTYQEVLQIDGPADGLLVAALVGMVAATVQLGRLAAPALEDPTTPAPAP
ncbi:DMT family transporter [Iamia majanohamensis]|uniref:DMT family transporter n=1 Tax=Iamia majanohamensis TaxID=467976 RepID=A0AAE9Y7C0_9ACTN|nr:DMT family transporter [Iamia majanohamensis]WCO68059.1 DMT family transporter [Iamia majanohamensis]